MRPYTTFSLRTMVNGDLLKKFHVAAQEVNIAHQALRAARAKVDAINAVLNEREEYGTGPSREDCAAALAAFAATCLA